MNGFGGLSDLSLIHIYKQEKGQCSNLVKMRCPFLHTVNLFIWQR